MKKIEIRDESSIKVALIQEDLHGNQSKSDFDAVCDEAFEALRNKGIGDHFFNTYLELARTSRKKLLKQLRADMLDNYMVAALASVELGVTHEGPLMAWAALNKKNFEGYEGEIACMRVLMWAGCDVNAKDADTESTALHYMCNLKWGKGVHVRALKHLIDYGANVNLQNVQGDTPIITLSGQKQWNSDADTAFRMLVKAGADLGIKASDGESALSLLTANQAAEPSPLREALITELEAVAQHSTNKSQTNHLKV